MARPRKRPAPLPIPEPVEITRDPLPLSEGGFSPGAAFEIDEFAGMLEAGCLAVGTAFTYHGQAYTVTGHNLARREDGRRFYGASLALRPVRQ